MSDDRHRDEQSAMGARRADVVVTQKALRRLEKKLKTRFRAYLKPGEKIALSVEEESDFVYARLGLRLPSNQRRLDLEAAVIVQDQDHLYLKSSTGKGRLLTAIDFLGEQLEQYFEARRQTRFHIDWRLYGYREATVRFRGQESQPKLEAEATALLDD